VTAYFDTGVLLKNYCNEPNSPDAISLILAESAPLPLTHFQEAELRNTFRLKVFRKEINSSTMAAAIGLLDEDIRFGRLERTVVNLENAYRRAEKLSEAHTISTGTRLLDILHVVAALEIGSIRFVSFDQRQRAMAKKAGLTILPR
jgi:predicted nucleic acid-binding protein